MLFTEINVYSIFNLEKKTLPIKFLAPVDILATKDKHPIFFLPKFKYQFIKGGLKMILFNFNFVNNLSINFRLRNLWKTFLKM